MHRTIEWIDLTENFFFFGGFFAGGVCVILLSLIGGLSFIETGIVLTISGLILSIGCLYARKSYARSSPALKGRVSARRKRNSDGVASPKGDAENPAMNGEASR